MDNPDKKIPAKDQLKTDNPIGQPANTTLHPHTRKFYILLIMLGVFFLASTFTIVVFYIRAKTSINRQKQSVSQSTSLQKITTPTVDLNREPTSSISIANWKTYTNTKYGFSFKYPSSLNVKETAEDGTSDIVVLVAANAKYPTLASRIHISIEKNTKNLTLDAYLKDIPTANNTGFRTFLIGGSEGRRGAILGAYNHDFVFALYKMFIYQLDLEISDDSITTTTYDQILSTFKFID